MLGAEGLEQFGVGVVYPPLVVVDDELDELGAAHCRGPLLTCFVDDELDGPHCGVEVRHVGS